MSEISVPSGFYVYRLRDPRTGLPFYVGKGQGRRAWKHEAEVRSGRPGGNARKVEKIASILASGNVVLVEIVATYLRETDALDHEYRLVDADPTLTNVLPGGLGGEMSPFRLQRMKEARARKVQKQRQEALKAAAERDQEREAEAKRRLSASAKDDRHRSEIEDWAGSLPRGVTQALRYPSSQALRLKAKQRRDEANQRRSEAQKLAKASAKDRPTYKPGKGLYGLFR